MSNNKVYEPSPWPFEKVHEFIGRIREIKLETVYNKKSEYHGNQYLRCQVVIEGEPEIKEFLVFKEKLEKETIWEEIEQKDYLDKRYLFKLQRRPGAGKFFRLLDWEIINYGKKK